MLIYCGWIWPDLSLQTKASRWASWNKDASESSALHTKCSYFKLFFVTLLFSSCGSDSLIQNEFLCSSTTSSPNLNPHGLRNRKWCWLRAGQLTAETEDVLLLLFIAPSSHLCVSIWFTPRCLIIVRSLFCDELVSGWNPRDITASYSHTCWEQVHDGKAEASD